MKEECIICKAPLEYLIEDTEMECAICHKKELSKTRCVNGHYVCNTCHMQGLDAILGVCLAETSKNLIEIMNKLMDLPESFLQVLLCNPARNTLCRMESLRRLCESANRL